MCRAGPGVGCGLDGGGTGGARVVDLVMRALPPACRTKPTHKTALDPPDLPTMGISHSDHHTSDSHK